MAQLIVRNLEDDVVQALRIRAAQHGRSAESEHRELLREALLGPRNQLSRASAESGSRRRIDSTPLRISPIVRVLKNTSSSETPENQRATDGSHLDALRSSETTLVSSRKLKGRPLARCRADVRSQHRHRRPAWRGGTASSFSAGCAGQAEPPGGSHDAPIPRTARAALLGS